MFASLEHITLGATLRGLQFGEVWQFRGLQYATISERFAAPGPPTALSGSVDCTPYGPRCPQNHIDFRHLLRIPPEEDIPEQVEDEFQCLNLDVTMPAFYGPETSKPSLPVLIWIHGGSQTVSFGTSSARICDPTNLIARSIQMSKPMIVVTMNYRLNAFAFGDCRGEINLALKDQRMAIDFVSSHIAGFGGDPSNITLAGESAGAVYCHAHMAMGSPIRQCVLQSGSLYLSPPQPQVNAKLLVDRLEAAVSKLGNWTMRNAPVQKLLDAQAELGLVSFYLQAEEQLEGWETKHGSVERLLIGDVEYESVLWHNGMQEMPAHQICEAFRLAGNASAELSMLYGIVKDRPAACRFGSLDLLNDAKFVLPVETMTEAWRHAQRPLFRFLVDQPNPWQSSSRAHHAVDLLYVFGAFDLSFNPAAQQVTMEMQQKWIEFVNGQDPWQSDVYWTFGPHGESRSIDDLGFGSRRRKRHLDALKRCGSAELDAVTKALAAGRLSLLN